MKVGREINSIKNEHTKFFWKKKEALKQDLNTLFHIFPRRIFEKNSYKYRPTQFYPTYLVKFGITLIK